MGTKEALQEFATAQSVVARYQALLELTKDRGFLHRSVETSEFHKGLTAMVETAKRAADGPDRLFALVSLSRIRAIVKPLQGRIEKELESCLELPLPLPFGLSNPDDRFYVAQACGVAWHDWMLEYLAEFVSLEESAERARAEGVRSLIANASSLEDIWGKITSKLAGWNPETESPGDSVARRIRRIIAVLRPVVGEYTGRVPVETGEAVCNLIRTAFRGCGAPSTISVISETTEEIVGLIHDLIRARFSLATEPTTYEAIRACSSWFQQHRWQNFTKESENIRLIVRDLTEGISLLARQGKTDAAMLSCLSLILGSREAANAAMARLAASLPNLQPNIREWLASGGNVAAQDKPTRSVLAEESQVQTENVVLADLLVDSERIMAMAHLIEADVLPEIQMLSPKQAGLVEKYIGQGRALADAVRAMATRRGLMIREHLDSVVEFSPLDHELVGGLRQGIRQVRVIRPVVEQISDGVPYVVRKGIVEKI